MGKFKSKSRGILAKNVNYLRYERKWSQEELAHRSKVSSSYISLIEQGKSNIGIDYIENIAFAFGLETSELLIDHGYKTTIKKRIDSKN